ncbi:hypothetical protein OOK60_08240 [Trichothermofontia sichuanensis B231]|uniref:hypothetical protein n=1 Tax=Trichothermofontia sichuanensis TaxID=3045816 RepID=UPI0022482868|nr:hypothetical protein [Trichothermofontia sichuanensis]UZQ56035.1 hypothetical protein OOK60_08240 [Trichothermofontia sichuanensis B231]
MQRQLKHPLVTTGWAVHVYDRDRRLRWVVEPAHAWALGWGMLCGLLLAIVGYNLADHRRPDSTMPPPMPTLDKLGTSHGCTPHPKSLAQNQ